MRGWRGDSLLTTDLPKCANGSYSIVTSRYLNSSDNIDLNRASSLHFPRFRDDLSPDCPHILFSVPGVDADQALDVPDSVDLAAEERLCEVEEVTLVQS